MTDLDDLVASSVREIAGEADAKVRRVDLSTVLAEGSRRSRRRRKRRQAVATGALIAAIVLVFVVPLPHLLLRHQTASTTVPTVPNANKVRKGSAGVSVAEMLAGRWSTMPPAPITARGDAAVVWTGRELIVWGGSAGPHAAHLYGDGAAYDPSTKSWRVLPPAPLPPTAEASAVWTGSEMVVFGGYVNESLGAFQVTNAAAAFDPSTNRWRTLPPAPLSPRAGAIAFWTGKSVIVLGGQPAVTTSSLQSYGDGAAYSPTTDTWQHIAAPTPPHGHQLDWQTAVQAGNKLLAFSRWAENRSLGHGTIEESFGADLFDYDLTTGSWSLVPARPDALQGPEEALWTGHLLVVRGSDCGFSCPETFASGVTDLYDPSGNTWTRISADPLGAVYTSAWTGDALFSFNPGTEPGAASLYDPSTHRWSLLPTAPFGCSSGQPVWTGRQILIYCPQFGAGAPNAAGLVYTPHLVGSAAPVEIQLVLDRTQVTAGTPIRGEALLTNTTGKTITVQTCAADGWLSVGLTNGQVSYSPLSPLIVCAPTVRLSPGLNRVPITISSDFQSCTQTRSQATPQLPVCTSRGAPSLPAGQYLTKIVIAGLPAGTRLPSAIKVTLLAPGASASSRATPRDIRVFVDRAEKGFHRGFSATYRTVDTLAVTGAHVPVTVTAVQLPWPLSGKFMAPLHFKYEQSGEDEFFFGALRSSYGAPGDYTCVPGHHPAWLCSQMAPGNGASLLMGAYLPWNTLSGLQALTGGVTVPDLRHDVYLTGKVVAGRKLTCLSFGSAKKPRATVCLTSGGIIGYYSSQIRASTEGPLGTTSLVSLSFHVTKADLTLPAKATAALGS